MLFATASRDKTVAVWDAGAVLAAGAAAGSPPSTELAGDGDEEAVVAVEPVARLPKFKAAVTAVAFAPRADPTGNRLLAVGLETGAVMLYVSGPEGDNGWEMAAEAAPSGAHTRAVRRIGWRGPGLLASCADDHTVRIFEVK